jgi:hypothetical protein
LHYRHSLAGENDAVARQAYADHDPADRIFRSSEWSGASAQTCSSDSTLILERR